MARKIGITLEKWHGDRILSKIRNVSGAALAEGAEVIAKKARANIRPHRLSKPEGFFRDNPPGSPGGVENSIKAGQFQGKIDRDFKGGFVRLTSLWWVVEFGTARSQPRPFLKPAVTQSRSKILSIVKNDLQRVKP